MNISAKVIRDSISEYNRITTIEISLPKILLAEFGTHRVFSRSFSSSRAIPTAKLLQQDYFEPLFYGKSKQGMQADSSSIENVDEAQKIWYDAIQYNKNVSEKLTALGLHKQWANRPCDWFIMAKGIVTSTEWDNFFNLRIHPDAQPEMAELATKIKQTLVKSVPLNINYNQWHLPYISPNEIYDYRNHEDKYVLQKISAARCCRVSYLNHNGEHPNIQEDLRLFEKLAGSNPKHYSPLEHIATPDSNTLFTKKWKHPHLHGNFVGWQQFRKMDELGLGL